MKALLFTHLYPSVRHPTRAVFNKQLFDAIGRECETRVVSPEPWWAKQPASGKYGDNLEEHVFRPGYWAIPWFQRYRAEAMYQGVRGLIRHIDTPFPFDVILAAWAYPDAVAAAKLAREFGRPLVVNVLGSDINALSKHDALKVQIQMALQQAAATVAVSGALAHRVSELGISKNKIVVIHNGVDGVRFSPRDRQIVREALGLGIEEKIVCYVGRLSEEKGVDVLLDAVRKMDMPIHLVLAGDGPLHESLWTQAKQIGIAEQVRFLGNVSHAEIPTWIAAADVLCLPSRREGCPNVVLEALASGVPVVASDVGGLPELISRENGILVPPDNADRLADALESALNRHWNPVALRNSVPHLSWDDVGKNYVRVLEMAVTERVLAA